MSRRVNLGVRSFAAAVGVTVLLFAPSQAAAQTTVVLDASDAFIRGGSYANTVYNIEGLATKANSLSNTRRSLLKFDTENTIPKGSSISSAKLVLTLRKSDPQTRKIGVYRVTTSFQETQATWYLRKTGYNWTSSGGDLSSKLTEFSVGTTLESKVTIDLTSLVQATVNGSYGSRYTRIALVDIGTASDTSYKEFYSSETSDSSKRPWLTVVYGGTASVPAPSTSTSTLKVLDWNTHYGVGTDGKYDINRIATFLAKFNPDVISLNEVTRYSHYNTSEDQAARYKSMLQSKTGKTWYYYYRTDNGASTGVGNIVLSRFPIASTSYCQLSTRRVAVNAAIYVNGRLVNVWSTHLDSTADNNSMRIAEVKVLKSCTSSFAEQKIIAGDFNARPGTTEITMMWESYYDAWTKAVADGTEIDYVGNVRYGATRNFQIDYIFFSKKASYLVLKRAQIYDTRDSSGYMPSDHKPLMGTFEVR